MAELQIPNLDQTTMNLLSQWAADHGRTVEDEVRLVLQQATQERSGSAWDRADALRETLAATGHAFSDSAELVREGRDQ